MRNSLFRQAILAIAALLLAPLPAAAQSWRPTRPIEVVVPFSAGSLADRNMRAAAPLLSRELGVPVAVQNIPGATGYNRLFRAAPDGHTIGAGDPIAQLGLALVQPQPFDITRLTWLGHWSTGVQVMVASARSGLNSLEELRGLRRTLRCGTFGGISTGAIQCALLGKSFGFAVSFVSVQGPPELVLAAVRGDVDLASLGATLWVQHASAGSIKPLLAWSAARDERLPNASSLADINLTNLADITVIRGVNAPPDLPAAIRDRLITALNAVTRQPEWEQFVAQARLERDWTFNTDYGATIERTRAALQDSAETLRSAF